MTNNIGQCFLRDTETFSLDNWIDASLQWISSKAGMQASQGSLSIGIPPEGGLEPEIIEHGRPQVKRKIVNLFEHFADCFDALLEPASEGILAGIFQGSVKVE